MSDKLILAFHDNLINMNKSWAMTNDTEFSLHAQAVIGQIVTSIVLLLTCCTNQD